MVIDRCASFSGAYNPNRVRYTDYHKNDARGKLLKQFGKQYKTIEEWKELNKSSRTEKGRNVDYYSFQGHKDKFKQSVNIKAGNKYSKLNKRKDDNEVSSKGQMDPYSHLYEKKVITTDSGNTKFKKSADELYKDDRRELFSSHSGFNDDDNLLPSQKLEHRLNIKQQAEQTLNNKIKGDIGSLMLSNIKAGSKRSTMETLEFIPAKKQSVYTTQEKLKEKYIVLKAKISLEAENPSTDSTDRKVGQKTGAKIQLEKKTGPSSRSKIPVPSIVISKELSLNDCIWSSEIKKKRLHSTGLYNSGNTCFLNAAIQVLTHTPALYNYLVNRPRNGTQNNHSPHKKLGGNFYNNNNHHFNNSGAYDMQDALSAHFNFIKNILKNVGPYTTQTKAMSPKKILEGLSMVANNRMHIGRQEDAHEYLRYVLDAIQKSMLLEAKRTNKIVNKINKECLHVKSTTVLHRIFGGYSRSRITCSVCKNVSDCFEPFLDLQLDLRNCSHIDECFKKYSKLDLLTGDNAYKCENAKCNKRRDATKQMTIEKAPQILTLQLKRFDGFGPFGGQKITRMIQYPQTLDLSKNMSKELHCDKLKYELYGVLVHSGHTCNSGHYYSFCKTPAGSWFCYNDSDVRGVKFNQVMAQSEAYLLFYTKSQQSFIGGDPYKILSSKIGSGTGSGTGDQKDQKSLEGESSSKESPPKFQSQRETIKEKEDRLAMELLEKRKKQREAAAEKAASSADPNGNFIGPMPPKNFDKFNPKALVELEQKDKHKRSPSRDALVMSPKSKERVSLATLQQQKTAQKPITKEQTSSDRDHDLEIKSITEKINIIQNDMTKSMITKKIEVGQLRLQLAKEKKARDAKQQLQQHKHIINPTFIPKTKTVQAQAPTSLVTSTSSLSKKPAQDKEKEAKAAKAKASLAMLADYDDSSTDCSQDSGKSSNSSGRSSKREKFLKRKADRMEKLGDVGETLPEKVNPPPKPTLPKPSDSSFFKLNVKTWDNQESTIDKQITHDLKKQKSSSLDKFDLEYDQERIEKADRRFDKRERKKEERREKEKKEEKCPGSSREYERNRFQEKANREEKRSRFK